MATGTTDLHRYVSVDENRISEQLRSIGVLIRRGRKEAWHESRHEFAERLGCTAITLDKLENGDGSVRLDLFMRAMHLLLADRDVAGSVSILMAISMSEPK